jgi:hypothetical protein
MTTSALSIIPDQTPPASAPRKAEIRVVSDPIAVLDTARFEHMQRIATVMANSNLIPDSLCTQKGENDSKVFLPFERVVANCFLVVNQSVRWNMDPFAVAQCVSVVYGKLCYEGKLIAAVLEGKAGASLEYEITGLGDAMKVVVSATGPDGKLIADSKGRPKVIEGTVGEWKTTGRGSPWDARGGHVRMLRYRGAREWGRVYAPGLMLGVYSDDEMEDLSLNHRAATARVVSDVPPAPPAAQVTHQQETAVQAEEQKADSPPAPPAVDQKSGGDMPDIPAALRRERPTPNLADPETLLKWIDDACKAVTDPHALETMWNDKIAPRLDALIPPDRDEAAGIYRRHEQRLAP